MKPIIAFSLCFLLIYPCYADKDATKKFVIGKEKSLAGSALRAMDLFLNNAGLKAAIKRTGLSGNSASQVESIVKLALKNITGTDRPNRETILQGLSIIGIGSDRRVKDSLIEILLKSEKDLTDADFVNAVNALVFLAGRYGIDNSLALACSACVGDTLAQRGFLFSYEQVTDKQTSFILKNVVPTDTRKLGEFIRSRLGRLELSPKASTYINSLSSADEKSFALFLSIPDHGSAAQNELFNAIKLISEKPNGSVDIFDSENSHNLWRLFGSNLNDLELVGWSRLLKDVARDAKTNGEISKKAAFLRYFEKKVSADPNLSSRFETIKRKNCFFN
ncbi:MAG: hypothetical protein K9K67_10885 [Bacteriovoracaceae bacterium]|nr:hypothetical protein [Bacteriovoracaceae bacterium]